MLNIIAQMSANVIHSTRYSVNYTAVMCLTKPRR